MNECENHSVSSFFILDKQDQVNRLEEIAALAEMMMNQNDVHQPDYLPGTINRIGNMIWQRLH